MLQMLQIGVTVVVSCDLNGEMHAEREDAIVGEQWEGKEAKVERSDRYGGGTMTSLR